MIAVAGLTGTAGAAAGASDASLSTVNETVRAHAVEDATVTGTTDLDAGANVSVRVQSSGDTTPRFFRSRQVRTGENGTVAATFDFSEHAPGDTFTVNVVHDGSTIAEAEGEVVADDVAVTRTGTPETTTETTGPGFGIGAAAAAVCLGAAFMARRRG
ncbi:BGTF surface domain-containing protein [Halobaculum magnesiiphilum]|uniref:PGF-CTERM sorting domain-containing protein n=1 Tax=Halobaculum magnesiiphilum TaxID=1017351 RepID=A0A8T8WDG6_9EURY|nr:BGTF surface domain-containing protein [Halobaculum magnesiiphilum]QZP37871.1 hypothetical protein K6T50_01460 [Halobaculum magnesiiphilum]